MIKHVSLLMTALLILTGCSSWSFNENNSTIHEKVPVTLSVHSVTTDSAKTILPSLPASRRYNFSGKKDGSSMTTQLASFTTSPFTLMIETATWDLFVDAYDGTTDALIGSGSLTNQTISGPVSLTFNLVPLATGNGTIDITLNWDSGAGILGVETLIDGTPLDPGLSPSGNSVRYTKPHAKGEYMVSFQLIDADGMLLGSYTELVRVLPGLTSGKSVTINTADLNKAPVTPGPLTVTLIPGAETAVSFLVEWDDNSLFETDYVLSYTDGTTTIPISLEPNTTSNTINNLEREITYTITVIARNAFGDSPVSQTAITTPVLSTITFSPGTGGSGTSFTLLGDIGFETLLSDGTDFSKSGYSFIGWATTDNATVVEYHVNDSYVIQGNSTLYAVWEVTAEIIPPTPGTVLSFIHASSTYFRSSWGEATDNSTDKVNLRYMVRYSTTTFSGVVATALSEGTQSLNWNSYITEHYITGLTPNTSYYVRVFVKDEANNVAMYNEATYPTVADNGYKPWNDSWSAAVSGGNSNYTPSQSVNTIPARRAVAFEYNNGFLSANGAAGTQIWTFESSATQTNAAVNFYWQISGNHAWSGANLIIESFNGGASKNIFPSGSVNGEFFHTSGISSNDLSTTTGTTYGIKITGVNTDSNGFLRGKMLMVADEKALMSVSKPQVVSSMEAVQFDKVFATNGKTTTNYWASIRPAGTTGASGNYSFPVGEKQWIYVDLGEQRTITQVKLYWEAAATTYQIYISDDATTWTTIGADARTAGANNSTDTVNLAAIGRYIRMTADGTKGTGGVALFEFEVWGY